MSVKHPERQARKRYLAQQLVEIHEVLNDMLEEGNAKRDLASLYLRAHKTRDALDAETERLKAEEEQRAAENAAGADPEAFEAELVEDLLSLPPDMLRRIIDAATQLRVVKGEG